MLADDLIKTGMKAKPKSKASQGEHIEKMVRLVREQKGQVKDFAKVVRFACQRLNKMGFTFYDEGEIMKKINY